MSEPPRPDPRIEPDPRFAPAAVPADPAELAVPADPAELAVPADPVEPVAADRRPRPVVERLGMAAIALVMAALFAGVAAAAFIGGEPFLGVMGVCGCLMVLWVGGITALRG